MRGLRAVDCASLIVEMTVAPTGAGLCILEFGHNIGLSLGAHQKKRAAPNGTAPIFWEFGGNGL